MSRRLLSDGLLRGRARGTAIHAIALPRSTGRSRKSCVHSRYWRCIAHLQVRKLQVAATRRSQLPPSGVRVCGVAPSAAVVARSVRTPMHTSCARLTCRNVSRAPSGRGIILFPASAGSREHSSSGFGLSRVAGPAVAVAQRVVALGMCGLTSAGSEVLSAKDCASLPAWCAVVRSAAGTLRQWLHALRQDCTSVQRETHVERVIATAVSEVRSGADVRSCGEGVASGVDGQCRVSVLTRSRRSASVRRCGWW